MHAAMEISQHLGTNAAELPTNGGFYYEWQIPERSISELPAELTRFLYDRSCRLVNVDSSRPPYWYVAVRLFSSRRLATK